MKTIVKILGALIIFAGLALLMSVYDNTTATPLSTILMGILGFFIIAVGGVFWVWFEPYLDETEALSKK